MSCADSDADSRDGVQDPRNWSLVTAERLADFAAELSQETLPHLSATAGAYGFGATAAAIIDSAGVVNGTLVLAEPLRLSSEDTLGTIIVVPGSQPGEAVLFTRLRR